MARVQERVVNPIGNLRAAGALCLFWLTLLRQRVQRQTSIASQRLHLEAALSERYRQLFESSTDLVFTIDTHGRFAAMNPVAKLAFGCTGRETATLNLRSFLRTEDRPLLTEVIALLIGGEQSILRHLSILPWSGPALILELNCCLRHGSTGPDSIDIIARDVTEQRREQTALELVPAAAEIRTPMTDPRN